MKYDKMVAITREESSKKINTAKKTIAEMLEERERISVASLVERTGLSRGFFYKNSEVRNVFDQAKHLQGAEGYEFKPILKGKDQADVQSDSMNFKRQNRELAQQNQVLEQENNELKRKLENLQKQLANKEISLLKSL